MIDSAASEPVWPLESIFPPKALTSEEAEAQSRRWWFKASDGERIAVQTWSRPAARPLGTFVVLHGVQSHAGWYHGLGMRLAGAGFTAHFPDRRGSGANPHERGHAPSSKRLLRDVAELLQAVRSSEGANILAGISWGGKLALVTAAEWPSRVDALALIGPGLTPRVGVSRRERLGVLMAMLTGRARTRRFPIPLADPALFTAGPAAQSFIAQDPLSLREGTAGLMAASFFLDQRVRRAPGRVRQPVLLMLAGQDRIVNNEMTLQRFERLASPSKTVIEYPESHHTFEFEPDPGKHARDLIGWALNPAVCRHA